MNEFLKNRNWKWATGGLEAVLAIPVVGGLVIMANGYSPLLIMLVLHAVALFLSIRQGKSKIGHSFGIATSCLGWIPFLGWTLHLVTAVILIVEAVKDKEEVAVTHEE